MIDHTTRRDETVIGTVHLKSAHFINGSTQDLQLSTALSLMYSFPLFLLSKNGDSEM